MSVRVNNSFTAEDFCLQSVASLEAHPLAPSKITRDNGLLDLLEAPRNSDPWNIIETSFDGKPAPKNGAYPKVTLAYEDPQCDVAAVSCDESATVCTTGGSTTRTDKYLDMIVDDCVFHKFSLSIDEFDQICESPNSRWVQELQRAHVKMRRQKSSKVINLVYTLLSDYPSGAASTGVTTATVPMINTDGTINNSGFAKVYRTYRDAFFSGNLNFAGGSIMQSYFDLNMLKAGSSIDRDFAMNLPFAYDSQIDPIVQGLESDSASHGFTFPDGTITVKDINENTGYKQFNLDMYTATTINIGGTEYDYWVRFNECNGSNQPEWTVLLRNRFVVPKIPDSVYCDAGFLYHWKFACGDWDCSVLDAA